MVDHPLFSIFLDGIQTPGGAAVVVDGRVL